MMMRLFTALGLVLCTTALRAQWSVSDPGKPVALNHGAWQVERQITGPMTVRMKLIFFDSARCQLKVVDAQTLSGENRNLGAASRSVSAIAGCNGGYFTPEFAPLGLQIADGKRTGNLTKSSLLGGLLQVRKGRLSLLWKAEYTEAAGTTDLLQAGPRLVVSGKAVSGLESVRRRSRTFILTDGAGHWAIGTCDATTIKELSDILATKDIIREFPVQRALNLDGGRSTGLWWLDAAGTEHYEREISDVRNFIAIIPKKKG